VFYQQFRENTNRDINPKINVEKVKILKGKKDRLISRVLYPGKPGLLPFIQGQVHT